ncbi:MAG: T9SS type A sorting domain-containing protein [candidate division Zixibacteria bacterium]|nr:T9SS type A sorting domain-containing protein [candidate division Zixibacteria bacterium]
MTRLHTALIALIIIISSSLAFCQNEYLYFEPIDSINTDFNYIKARDLNDDGYDEIFICSDAGVFIYNGYNRNVLWADSVHSDSARWVEIGDIEQDGAFELFVGSFENGNSHLYIYPGMDVNLRFEWPGNLSRWPGCLYFYFEENTSYLNFLANGGYTLNLENWQYEYTSINGSAIGYYDNKLFTKYGYYGGEDSYHRYFKKYSFNYVEEASYHIYSSWPDEYLNHYRYAFGNFQSNQSIEIYLHNTVYHEYYGVPTLELYLLDNSFEQLHEMAYDSILNPTNFIAANIIDDSRDELLLIASIADDSVETRFILFDEMGSILAYSQFESIGILKLACNIDDDEFDELLVSRNGYLVFIDPSISEVDIKENDILPIKFSASCYPNPFNSQVNIDVNTAIAGNCKVEVYNLLGQSVKLIFDGYMLPGKSSFIWRPNLSNASSGLYLLKISENNRSTIKRMAYIK